MWPSEELASNLSPDDAAEVREACLKYAISLVEQIDLRLSKVWKLLEVFSILNMALQDPQPDLEKLLNLEVIKEFVPQRQSDHLVAQWASLPQHHLHLRGHITDVAFWAEVSENRQAIPENFELLSSFALKMLTLPYSSHVVQQCSDMMRDIKGSTRMGLDLLTATMMIRSTVEAEGLCWSSFPLPDFVMGTPAMKATSQFDLTFDEYSEMMKNCK